MAIEQKQFLFNSSPFTDPKWVPSTFTNEDVFPTDFLESLLTQQSVPPVSELETRFSVLKQERRFQPITGKVSKRKSRASKRATTTFITADVSNFRQMVQQVTGVRVTSEVPVVKPEPSYNAATSFLLGEGFFMNGLVQQEPVTVVESGGSGGGFGMDGFCSFPTLESWKV